MNTNWIKGLLDSTGLDELVLSEAVIASCIDDDIDSLLDIGCGNGERANEILTDRNAVTRYGVDVYRPNLNQAAQSYDDVILADGANPPLRPDCVDCVMALDFIEHLEKEAGLQFLERIETLARKQVILFTPSGYVPQRPYDGNEFQRHKSGWAASELEARGYNVHGINGLKPFRGRRGRPAGNSVPTRKISHFATHLTQPIAYHFPQYAYQMICMKRVE